MYTDFLIIFFVLVWWLVLMYLLGPCLGKHDWDWLRHYCRRCLRTGERLQRERIR